MWFHLGYENFISKGNSNANSCDIFISDFKRIWHRKLSNDEIISISQMMNPLLEASITKLKDLIINSLEDVKTQKQIKEENNEIILTLESNFRLLKFRFETTLNEGNNEMFYKEFTIPLLKTIINAQNRENKLIKIIEDKDLEITEYKQEYGVLKSYFKITKPFIQKEFDCIESGTNISRNLSSFLEQISSRLLPSEQTQTLNASQELQEKFPQEKKSDPKVNCFKDKNINRKIESKTGSKSCVNLDNQTVKRRKHSNTLKLKF